MTCNTQRQIPFIICLVAAILVSSGNIYATQMKVSPLSDYQYKTDYSKYDAVNKETDPLKKADGLLGYLKERPISRLLQTAAGEYMKCVAMQKDPVKIASMIEALLAIIPTEESVRAAQKETEIAEEVVVDFISKQISPLQQTLLNSLGGVYFQSKNYPKSAEIFEKLYGITHDKAMLGTLASVYQQFNTEKYIEYGQKVLAEFPFEQAYSVALGMLEAYGKLQNKAAVNELAVKLTDAFGEKLPPNLTEAQWNPIRASLIKILAQDAKEKKDYPKAIEIYGKITKFDPKNDEAYYNIAMCTWQNGDQKGAIEPFARVVVLNKTFAVKAKTYLEQLYKTEHNNTLDGLDQLLATAKADLGI
jgi:tetratricopeptide (TPR) repeat protein